MQPRQPIGVTCASCGKGGLLLRVRGLWQGRVKELGAALNSPAIQLPAKGDGYTLDGFRCWRCRETACETCRGNGGPASGDLDSDGVQCRNCGA